MIVFIVMLLIPSELTDEQLAQIKPGMTMEEVHHMIGKPNVQEGWSVVSVGEPTVKGEETIIMWDQSERWLQPRVDAIFPANGLIKLNTIGRTSFWIGRSNMLWVEHDQDRVLNVWLIPVNKTGGGLQGIINTLREYWGKWWK